MMGEGAIVPVGQIERRILLIRGERVMLDSDLAALYGVETKILVKAVKRNLSRFPPRLPVSVQQGRVRPFEVPNWNLKEGAGR